MSVLKMVVEPHHSYSKFTRSQSSRLKKSIPLGTALVRGPSENN